jgi:hypothetical protein
MKLVEFCVIFILWVSRRYPHPKLPAKKCIFLSFQDMVEKKNKKKKPHFAFDFSGLLPETN